jgi:type I restriction enzyme R subunit
MTGYPAPSLSRISSFYEEEVEQAALAWLEELGWRVLPGDYLAPDGPAAARSDYRETILVPELRQALETLNPQATPAMIDQAVRAVLAAPSADLIENNRAFYRLLVEGVSVDRQVGGERLTTNLRLVDPHDPAANRLIAANQFVVQGDKEVIRPDLTLFVNGVPLAVVELKNPTNEVASLEMAWTKIQNYKAKAPDLFRANAALVVSDGLEARIGSLTAGFDRFMPWRTIDGERIDDQALSPLEVVIRGALAPEHLIPLALDYSAFETDDGRVKSKKLAGYHQYHAVKRALGSTLAAAGAGGDRRGGVVWHTQGAGKSLTMLFFVRQLQLATALGNPTIVVLTDRNDLDDQLFGTFAGHGGALRGTPVRADSVEDLRQQLRVDVGGIVFTTIQKFRGEDGSHPELTDRSNVIVIADEAHRTQYGFRKRYVTTADGVREEVGFAEYVRQALPNATFVGFTGTPIEAKDRNTRGVFGDYVDVYDMAAAVTDKATVPIHYTARLARLHLKLSEEERAQLDALSDELTEGDSAATERQKSRLARFEQVVGSPDRVDQVAADIVEHFERRREGLGGGKAMVVAMSRRIAVALHDAISALRPGWASEDDDSGFMKVVMTATNDDPQHWQPHKRSKAQLERLAERFKKPESGFDLVIVRDMWLTGFDAPALHTLYVDKPMRGHNLMQAIARVNRVFGAKPGGLVVDYLGIGNELKEALAEYSAGDRNQVKLDEGEAVRIMLARLESAAALLGGVDWRPFFGAPPTQRLTILKHCLEHILATDRRSEFLKTVAELEVAFALCAGSEAAAGVRNEVGLMVALRANLMKHTTDGGRTRAQVERELRQLLSRAVVGDGILDVFKEAGLDNPDISILSEEFLADVRQMEEKNLAIEALRRLLADEIKVRERSNIIQAKKLTERLDEALRKYHNRAVDSVQVIEELIALARELGEAVQRGEELGLTDEELAFYDALAENGSARDLMAVEDLRVLAQALVRQIRNSATIDWTKKASVQAKMRLEVRKLLARYGYPPDLQKAAVDLVIQQAEGLARNWAA